jgi:hypothetical protein
MNAHVHYMANLIRKTSGIGVRKINTWSEILGHPIIGSFFIPHRLSGADYLNLLQEVVRPAFMKLEKIMKYGFNIDCLEFALDQRLCGYNYKTQKESFKGAIRQFFKSNIYEYLVEIVNVSTVHAFTRKRMLDRN